MYFLIVLFATTVGAVAGIGGGIIIKPLMDLVTNIEVVTVGILSSVCVLTMSATTIIRHMRQGNYPERRIAIWLGLGSIIGGVLGEQLLDITVLQLAEGLVKSLQAGIMMLTLLFVFVHVNFLRGKIQYNISSKVIMLIVGLLLGIMSSFLGIGGGPINISLLTLLFTISVKEATLNSLTLIFLAQLAKIILIQFSTGFAIYDLRPLVFMLPAAIMGGILGAQLNKKFTEGQIILLYNLVSLLVLFINISTIYRFWK